MPFKLIDRKTTEQNPYKYACADEAEHTNGIMCEMKSKVIFSIQTYLSQKFVIRMKKKEKTCGQMNSIK